MQSFVHYGTLFGQKTLNDAKVGLTALYMQDEQLEDDYMDYHGKNSPFCAPQGINLVFLSLLCSKECLYWSK